MLFSEEPSLMLEDGWFGPVLMCSFIQQTVSPLSQALAAEETSSPALYINLTAVIKSIPSSF